MHRTQTSSPSVRPCPPPGASTQSTPWHRLMMQAARTDLPPHGAGCKSQQKAHRAPHRAAGGASSAPHPPSSHRSEPLFTSSCSTLVAKPRSRLWRRKGLLSALDHTCRGAAAAERLGLILDDMHASKVRLGDRFQVLGPEHRSTGSHGVVQLAVMPGTSVRATANCSVLRCDTQPLCEPSGPDT